MGVSSSECWNVLVRIRKVLQQQHAMSEIDREFLSLVKPAFFLTRILHVLKISRALQNDDTWSKGVALWHAKKATEHLM